MAILHTLKCWPEFFEAMHAGHKTFDYRKADRDFRTGDCVLLREYFPALESHGAAMLAFEIMYILTNRTDIGLPKGYCVLALQPWIGEFPTETARVVATPGEPADSKQGAPGQKASSSAEILLAAATYFTVEPAAAKGSLRGKGKENARLARRYAAYLIRTLCNWPHQQISKFLGIGYMVVVKDIQKIAENLAVVEVQHHLKEIERNISLSTKAEK